MSQMNPNQLNLISDFFPVCLMKCKGALNLMRPGDRLDVIVADEEIADALVEIINHSDDTQVIRHKQHGQFRLRFFKQWHDKERVGTTTLSGSLNKSAKDGQ